MRNVCVSMYSLAALLVLGGLRAWAEAFQFHPPGKAEHICRAWGGGCSLGWCIVRLLTPQLAA